MFSKLKSLMLGFGLFSFLALAPIASGGLYFPLIDAAHAQTMPVAADVGMEEALGNDTADAETGIYQIRETIEDGWGVIIVIVLTVVGFMLVRRLFRRAGAN